jgi:hypothetical protein
MPSDILDWLEPDWVLNTDTGELLFFFVRPAINIKIYRTNYDSWRMFKDHHYLDANINKASRCYIGVWDDQIVALVQLHIT